MKEFNYHADLLMEKLKKSAVESTAVCISDELNSLTLDIISKVNICGLFEWDYILWLFFFVGIKTALGIDTNTINHPNQDFKTSVIKSLQGIQEFVTDPLIKVSFPKKGLKITLGRLIWNL